MATDADSSQSRRRSILWWAHEWSIYSANTRETWLLRPPTRWRSVGQFLFSEIWGLRLVGKLVLIDANNQFARGITNNQRCWFFEFRRHGPWRYHRVHAEVDYPRGASKDQFETAGDKQQYNSCSVFDCEVLPELLWVYWSGKLRDEHNRWRLLALFESRVWRWVWLAGSGDLCCFRYIFNDFIYWLELWKLES